MRWKKNCGEFLSFDRPAGGFYLWVKLHELPAESVWRTAAEEGVAFNQGTNFFPARHSPMGEYLRLAYPWTPMQDIEEGVARIRTACERVAAGQGA